MCKHAAASPAAHYGCTRGFHLKFSSACLSLTWGDAKSTHVCFSALSWSASPAEGHLTVRSNNLQCIWAEQQQEVFKHF